MNNSSRNYSASQTALMWSLIMRRLLGRSQLFTWLHSSSPLHQLLVLSREPHETWEAFLKKKLLWTVQFQNILPCYAPLHESPGETRNPKWSYKRMKVTSKPGRPRALLLPMCVPGGHHLVLLGVEHRCCWVTHLPGALLRHYSVLIRLHLFCQIWKGMNKH